MKKIAIIPLVVLCLASCTQKQPDIYKQAIETEIIRLVGPDAKVRFNTIERIDSTTYAKELAYRKGLISARMKQNMKFMKSYQMEGQKTNAAKKEKAAQMDAEVLKGIDAICERLAASDSLDIVIYYDYHVTGEAKSSSGTTEFPDHYACVATDGTLLNFTDNLKSLHKSLGKTIPGYMKVLKGGSEEAEKE